MEGGRLVAVCSSIGALGSGGRARRRRGATEPGVIVRRTVANTPVLEVVELETAPVLPAQQALKRVAARRCGARTARASWAVIFGDTESPICCTKDIRFVVRLENGWWVY